MKNLRNKVQLIGRLGMDPEIKKFDNDQTLAKFSMATDESYWDKKGKKVEQTQWHNIVMWGNLAKIAENYLKKGKEVFVEGRLSHRSYADNNGIKKYITEIIANDVMMIGKKEQAA